MIGRIFQITVSGQDEALGLSGLRCKFSIKRGDLQTPNTCDIRIYNPSPQTVSAIKHRDVMAIYAGNPDNSGLIFEGQVAQARRGKESAVDSYLDITAADGDSAYNFAFMSTSIPAGYGHLFTVETIAAEMDKYGVAVGHITPEISQAKLPRGKVLYGMAKDKLRQISREDGCAWSIQEGKLQLVSLSGTLPGEAFVISAATGMIGIPEQIQTGIKVRTLLNPMYKIGARVQIDNASINRYRYGMSLEDTKANAFVPTVENDGMYYIMIAEHTGDTRGQEWYTDLTCLGVNAALPPALTEKAGVKPYGS